PTLRPTRTRRPAPTRRRTRLPRRTLRPTRRRTRTRPPTPTPTRTRPPPRTPTRTPRPPPTPRPTPPPPPPPAPQPAPPPPRRPVPGHPGECEGGVGERDGGDSGCHRRPVPLRDRDRSARVAGYAPGRGQDEGQQRHRHAERRSVDRPRGHAFRHHAVHPGRQ